jgi:hypothetical protein
MNNILALFTIILAGLSFFFIFRNLFSELVKTAILTKKDGFFMFIATILVFIVYILLERLQH